MIKMTFLENIYRQMREKSITQCHFPYTLKTVKFDVLFDIETSPFTLIFGVLQKNIFFSFNVERGFLISNTYIENSTFKQLVSILELKFDPNNHFKPIDFLKTFNDNASAGGNIHQATYSCRVPFFSKVEEADKIYFKMWLIHNGKRHVTHENLEKTRCWLGERAYQYCKQRNISSCWTANHEEAQNPSQLPL